MQSSFLEDMFLGKLEEWTWDFLSNVKVKFSFIIYLIPWKKAGTGFRWQIATVETSQFTKAKDEQKFVIKVSEDRIVI